MDICIMPSWGGVPRQLTNDGRSRFRGICWTADSREIIFPMEQAGIRSLWRRIPVSGGSAQSIKGTEDATDPVISSRGDRLAYSKEFDHWEICRIDLTGEDPLRRPSRTIISSTRSDGSPVISPDGSRIAFSSRRSGGYQIWMSDRDGTQFVQLTNLAADSVGSPFWSPNGQFIAFDATPAGNSDIYLINPESRQVQQLTKEPSEEIIPSWSSDGRWVYFGSNRSGTWQIWKTRVDTSETVQVTKNGGFLAYESTDGKFLYFTKQYDKPSIWKMPVDGGQESLVLQSVPRSPSWTLTERGIYFTHPEANPRPGIAFFDFMTRRISRIAVAKEGLGIFDFARWLSVSADEKWLVYSAANNVADIMMIDHFQ